MGGKNSRLLSSNGQADEGAPATHPPLPHIEAPYGGPWAEYQFIDVTVPVDGDVTFSFSDVPMTSTRSSCALTSLEGLYAQGYSLVTFCRIPSNSQQKRPFTPGKDIKYQGIFCRYEGDPGNEGWNLRVEKSLLHVQHVTPGVVATETGPGAQHVTQLISNTVQTGGRLLTVQWSGQAQPANAEAALGVDVMFEVPVEPLPERSVYQLVTAPANLVRRSLFTSKGHVACDWTGILTRHLARGWRLADVFCEVPTQAATTALSPTHSKIQTVWFFEKPEARARDDTPVYEGTIVEHWVDVSGSVRRSSSCLGGGAAGDRRPGSAGGGKRVIGKMGASLRRKGDDVTRGGGGDVTKTDDAKEGETSKSAENAECSQNKNRESKNEKQNHVKTPTSKDSAGWEGVIRSMGEKGWELACVINTLDTQVVGGCPRVKVLLVFQRRLSLVHCVQGRRTSDGLALRADTSASTSAMCDLPLMTGETASHLNPSLAVRLPLSRSASRDGTHEDFHTLGDDDIPSTIGGPCSRTNSATELYEASRTGQDTLLLGPRGSSKGYSSGGLLRPKGSVCDEGSITQSGRSSFSSGHSKVTAEIHSSGEASLTPTNESTRLEDSISSEPKGGSMSQDSDHKGGNPHGSDTKGGNSQDFSPKEAIPQDHGQTAGKQDSGEIHRAAADSSKQSPPPQTAEENVTVAQTPTGDKSQNVAENQNPSADVSDTAAKESTSKDQNVTQEVGT